MSQLTRLFEFVQEMKDCKDLSCQLTNEVWCNYIDAWMTPDTGYVAAGGVRPTRPHPEP